MHTASTLTSACSSKLKKERRNWTKIIDDEYSGSKKKLYGLDTFQIFVAGPHQANILVLEEGSKGTRAAGLLPEPCFL